MLYERSLGMVRTEAAKKRRADAMRNEVRLAGLPKGRMGRRRICDGLPLHGKGGEALEYQVLYNRIKA